MSKFRKKPVVVDAWRWNGEPLIASAGTPEWISAPAVRVVHFVNGSTNLEIKTLEGCMIANIGDWIIKGVKGELYPCKPDIFEATYETVGDNS